MGKVIDISARLNNEKPKLKLGEGKEYTVNDRKSTMLILNQKMKNSDLNDVEEIDKILEVLLGKEAVAEINEMDPSFADYQTIFMATIASAMGEDLEEVEERFRQP